MRHFPVYALLALALSPLRALPASASGAEEECPGGVCRVPAQVNGTAVEEARNFVVKPEPGAVPAGDACTTGKCRRQQVVAQAPRSNGYGGTDLPPTPAPSGLASLKSNPFMKDYGPTIAGGAGGLLIGLGVGAALAAIGVGGPVLAVAAVCGLVLGLVIGHKFLGSLFG